MALRDLLVYTDQSESAHQDLRLAADLARRHGSRLTALFVRAHTPMQLREQRVAELGLASADAMARENRHIERSIDECIDKLRSELTAYGERYGLATEWRSVEGPPSALVPQHARYADLCVVSQAALTHDATVEYTFAEQLLFVTGRPVLFVPTYGEFETLGRHILVAWNSSRASTRAVNDALSLIEGAQRTTVLTVNPAEIMDRHRGLPSELIVEHLRRHSAAVEGMRLDHVPAGSVAEAVLREAANVGADLIVAGAFGHPRLWEKLLGGVTRDLLARMTLPVMMAH